MEEIKNASIVDSVFLWTFDSTFDSDEGDSPKNQDDRFCLHALSLLQQKRQREDD